MDWLCGHKWVVCYRRQIEVTCPTVGAGYTPVMALFFAIENSDVHCGNDFSCEKTEFISNAEH